MREEKQLVEQRAKEQEQKLREAFDLEVQRLQARMEAANERSVISCNKRWRSSQLTRCGRKRVKCWIELQHLAELLDLVVAGLAPHPANGCVDDCSCCRQVKQTRELEERAAQQARFMEKNLEEAERRAAEREKEMKEVLHQKEQAEVKRLKVRLCILQAT